MAGILERHTRTSNREGGISTNFRKASTRDRQVEAWTKIPEDEARVISELAKDLHTTEYGMIRKLIRVGMVSMCTYDKRYANKPAEIKRVRAAAGVEGSECPWFFSFDVGAETIKQ